MDKNTTEKLQKLIRQITIQSQNEILALLPDDNNSKEFIHISSNFLTNYFSNMAMWMSTVISINNSLTETEGFIKYLLAEMYKNFHLHVESDTAIHSMPFNSTDVVQ